MYNEFKFPQAAGAHTYKYITITVSSQNPNAILVRQRKFQSWRWAKVEELSIVKQICQHRKPLNFFLGIHNYKEIIRRRFKTVLLPCLWCYKTIYCWCLGCPLCSVTTISFKHCYKLREAIQLFTLFQYWAHHTLLS